MNTKYLILTLFTILGLNTLIAQKTQGKIVYEELMKFEIELSPEMQQFANLIPTENRTNMDLYFNAQSCLYKKAPEKPVDEDVSFEGVETQQIFIGGGEATQLYRDLKQSHCVRSEDLMGKQFLIEGDCNKMEWKIEGEQKKISGYNCIKATATINDDETAEAWFTPEIPLPLGPSEFYGLPGAIIHLTLNTGNTPITYAAVDISFDNYDAEITQPTKGKKVSPEEFEKIMKKRMEEMEAMMGGEESSVSGDGNNVTIKIIGN